MRTLHQQTWRRDAQGCRAISGTYVVEQERSGAILALAPAERPGRALGPLEALTRALGDLPPAERCALVLCVCSLEHVTAQFCALGIAYARDLHRTLPGHFSSWARVIKDV